MLEKFTLTEISITVVAIIGACASLIVVLEKSRCSNINLCCGLLMCDRVVPPVEGNDIENP